MLTAGSAFAASGLRVTHQAKLSGIGLHGGQHVAGMLPQLDTQFMRAIFHLFAVGPGGKGAVLPYVLDGFDLDVKN